MVSSDPKDKYKKGKRGVLTIVPGQIDPSDYEMNKETGLALARERGGLMVAEPFIARALTLNGPEADKEVLLSTLALIFKFNGDPHQSADIFSLLSKVHPDNWTYRKSLCEALIASGRLDEASPVLEGVLEEMHESAKKLAAAKGGPVTEILTPWDSTVTHFGELALRLDMYLKSRQLGLSPETHAVLSPYHGDIGNKALLNYWRNAARGQIEFQIRAKSDGLAKDYDQCLRALDILKIPDGRTANREIASLAIQRRWEDEGRPPLLSVSEKDLENGLRWLEARGMPEGGWFVPFHVRSDQYWEEYKSTLDANKYRNADIENYIPAMEEVVARGGWVVRLGGPDEPALPDMKGVIDYAPEKERADWLDVFFCARARFLVGSISGPFNVATVFGVPVLGTNWFPLGYWPLSIRDLFIHKLLLDTNKDRLVSIRDFMKLPMGVHSPQFYEAHGLEVVQNTSGDIRAAVQEMLDRLDGRFEDGEEDKERVRQYMTLSSVCGIEQNARPVAAFLKAHPDLLEEAEGRP